MNLPTHFNFPTDGRTPNFSPAEPDDLRLPAIWNALVRNRWLILGSVFLVLVAGGVYTLRQPQTYQGTATLRIQERQMDLSQVYQTLSTGVAGSDLGTEMQVLESRVLREDAVRDLGLQLQLIEPTRISRERVIEGIAVSADVEPVGYRLLRRTDGRFDVFVDEDTRRVATSGSDGSVRLPGATFRLTAKAAEFEELRIRIGGFDGAVDALSGGIWIDQPRRDAYVVQVNYSTPDRLLASAVPNRIVASYMSRRQRNRTAEARSTAGFLREQLRRVEQELTAAEDAFRSYQQAAGVLDPEVQTSSEVGRLTAKESERSSVESEREALRRSLEEIEAAAATDTTGISPYRRLAGLPFMLRSPTASSLITALVTAETERASHVGATAADPDVKVLDAKIEDLERQLHSMAVRYLWGLNGQIASLDKSLGEFRRQLDAIPAKRLEYARLERKVKALDEVQQLLQQKLSEAEIAEAAQDPSVQVIDPATPPAYPTSPQPVFNAMVAGIAGILLGLLLTLVREYRDKSVHTRKDIVLATGVPVLALIPRIKRGKNRVALIAERTRLVTARSAKPREAPASAGGHYTFLQSVAAHENGADHGSAPTVQSIQPPIRLALSKPGGAVVEAYGLLQTSLAFAQADPPLKVIVVTSPLAEEGKTTCATNLAITLAFRGSRTLLVDADLRRGVVHSAFECPRAPGFSELLAGQGALDGVVRTVRIGEEDHELAFLTSGGLPPNPSGLLESGVAAFVKAARPRFDFVIIDSPPVNIISDASLLGLHADGVVLVARSGITHAASLAYATEQLMRVGVRILGVVLNAIDFKREAGYDSSYRYYTEYEASGASR